MGESFPFELISGFPSIFNGVITETKVTMFLIIFYNMWPSRSHRLYQFPVWKKNFQIHWKKIAQIPWREASIRPSSFNTRLSQNHGTNLCEMLLHKFSSWWNSFICFFIYASVIFLNIFSSTAITEGIVGLMSYWKSRRKNYLHKQTNK